MGGTHAPVALTDQISVASQDVSVFSPLHYFLRLSVRNSCSDFVQSSLHQGRGFESHLQHRKATLLTYESQTG